MQKNRDVGMGTCIIYNPGCLKALLHTCSMSIVITARLEIILKCVLRLCGNRLDDRHTDAMLLLTGVCTDALLESPGIYHCCFLSSVVYQQRGVVVRGLGVTPEASVEALVSVAAVLAALLTSDTRGGAD